MGYKGILVDKLVAKNGDMFTSDSQAGYTDAFDYSTLPDNAWITKLMLIAELGGLLPAFRLPFNSVSNVTINWQTDIATGGQTYFELYGNFVEAFVYLSTGTPLGQPYTWTLDGSSNVDVVTFDWGSSATGYIRFN